MGSGAELEKGQPGPRRIRYNSPVAHPHDQPALFCIELRTIRWAELVEWYRTALGLRVLVRVVDDGYALLAAGGVRLAILARPAPGEASRRWSLGFEVADLEATAARLAAAGTTVTVPVDDPEGFREVVVSDPDGNRIRLFAWQRAAGGR